eukprot:scaffold36436_cov176-Amphora_coffeaeformis.AAC.4
MLTILFFANHNQSQQQRLFFTTPTPGTPAIFDGRDSDVDDDRVSLDWLQLHLLEAIGTIRIIILELVLSQEDSLFQAMVEKAAC